MPTRRAAIAGAIAMPAILRPARAQAAWPTERAIEVIIPFPPGGGVDAMARFSLFHVGQRIPNARFVFVNRAGASGQLGMEYTFNAAADGYTIGAMGSLNVSTLPLERAVRWRAEDFTYIANVVDDACALWVRHDSPIRSLDDLVRALRARPESLSVGSAAGVGSDDHLILLALEEFAAVRALHAPYNGTAPTQRDLLSGVIDVGSFNIGEGITLMRENRIRCLGQASPTRWSLAADVPTFREQGLDVLLGSARGIAGPPNMPPDVTRQLRDAFTATFADPRFVTEAERVALPLRPLVGDAFKAMVMSEATMIRALFARRPWGR